MSKKFGIMLNGSYLMSNLFWTADNTFHTLLTFTDWDDAHKWLNTQIVAGVISETACICEVFPDAITLVDESENESGELRAQIERLIAENSRLKRRLEYYLRNADD